MKWNSLSKAQLERICKIQKKVVKYSLLFNLILLLIIPINTCVLISIHNNKDNKTEIKLAEANHKIELLTSKEPEVLVELLKPIEDYSKEDMEKYNLPPLPETIKPQKLRS